MLLNGHNEVPPKGPLRNTEFALPTARSPMQELPCPLPEERVSSDWSVWGCKVLLLLTPINVNCEWPAQLQHALWGWLKPSLRCIITQLLPLLNPVFFSFPQALIPRAPPISVLTFWYWNCLLEAPLLVILINKTTIESLQAVIITDIYDTSDSTYVHLVCLAIWKSQQILGKQWPCLFYCLINLRCPA